MKRLLAFFAGGFGLGALFGRRSRPAAATLTESPADGLRQRLAESRASEAEPAEIPSEPEPQSAEDRRANVHERARAAIDELSSD